MIKSFVSTCSGWLFDTKRFDQIKGELMGYAQIKNASTVLAAVRKLQEIGYSITTKAIRKGFKYVCEITGLMGRWQILQTNPKVICDTGHNIGGMKYIVEQLNNEKFEKLHFILGMVNDKDITSILEILPKNAIYYFTKANIPRSLNENDLATQGQEKSLEGKAYQTVKESIIAAQKAANEKDLIFIGGSNFIVAEALEYFVVSN